MFKYPFEEKWICIGCRHHPRTSDRINPKLLKRFNKKAIADKLVSGDFFSSSTGICIKETVSGSEQVTKKFVNRELAIQHKFFECNQMWEEI
ncbi:hypothetical protein AVEN_1344-1 [Araneus ventricosus]|uniref:Uncharacterized protein n=1 Tax=Araneus ventricosus TaxID=182803 RepID=A0A4Y2D2U3_ARAVE|nr:hypothetical protein AVEN_1344-1 [Araneus ventricosus]